MAFTLCGARFFVKCDERELLTGFTAEADQLELLSRSNTVSVPKVWAVGADRDYSFLVMDFLPPRPLDAHNAFILGQQLAHLHEWSDQPQFGLDFDNALSTTPQPNTWQRRWSTFLQNSGLAGNWSLPPKKGSHLAILTPLLTMFSSVCHHTSHSLHYCMAICGRGTAPLALMVPTSLTPPAIGATESATWQCCHYIAISHRKFMTAISRFPPAAGFSRQAACLSALYAAESSDSVRRATYGGGAESDGQDTGGLTDI